MNAIAILVLVACWLFFVICIVAYFHKAEVNRHKQRDEERRVITSRYIEQDQER